MWMSVSIVVVPIVLYGLSRCLSCIRRKRNPDGDKDNEQQQLQTSPYREYKRIESIIIYILSMNLMQCKICGCNFKSIFTYCNLCLDNYNCYM